MFFFEKKNQKAFAPLSRDGADARADDGQPTTTLWRPVGPAELALIKESGMRAFSPRLPDQPIFYPVLTEDYAVKIARDRNAPRDGGYVTCFQVRSDFLARYTVQDVGGRHHQEYWITAEDLPAFNDAIVGEITVTQAFT